MSAVVAVFVRRTIADSQVEFNTQANSLSEALTIAQQLANGTADAAATTQAAISKAAKESKTSNPNAPATSGNDAGTASTEKSSQPSASTAEKSSDATSSAAPKLDYEKDIKPRVLTLSKDKGRDATIATLSRFGVAKATELSEDQWPAFLEFVNKVIAGEANPEEALA
ncbi:hypothetical protein [Cupriavidus metallidurans]|uniref:hypothetical protein n=1 Tax=Cupriavidus metallidurans TaxID=119219 RepID=UPI0035C6BA92